MFPRSAPPNPSPAMSPAPLNDYLRRIEADLRGNILPFWMDRVVNREGNCYFGSLTNDLAVDPGAKAR